jgi:esterase/lipase
VIGISLGGLLAAKLQEGGRRDLPVICISSPTNRDRAHRFYEGNSYAHTKTQKEFHKPL